MDVRKALLFIGLILCWISQARSQFQCACNDTQHCSATGELHLATLVHGAPGLKGSKGDAGPPGASTLNNLWPCSFQTACTEPTISRHVGTVIIPLEAIYEHAA